MRSFSFIVQNNLIGKEVKKADLFEGEQITYKSEDIKYEDE